MINYQWYYNPIPSDPLQHPCRIGYDVLVLKKYRFHVQHTQSTAATLRIFSSRSANDFCSSMLLVMNYIIKLSEYTDALIDDATANGALSEQDADNEYTQEIGRVSRLCADYESLYMNFEQLKRKWRIALSIYFSQLNGKLNEGQRFNLILLINTYIAKKIATKKIATKKHEQSV